MEVISKAKFPSLKHIKHKGYEVLSRMQVASIRYDKTENWSYIVENAEQIPNVADQSFILLEIAEKLPSKEYFLRDQIIKKAKILIESISSSYDRIKHYEKFIASVKDIDTSLCKTCLHKAMEDTLGNDDPEFSNLQKNLVDLAYKLDPELASSLVSLSDKDEARVNKRNLQHRLRLFKEKDDIATENFLKEPKTLDDSDYSVICWMLLGDLCIGNIKANHLSEIKELFRTASRLPLSDSYPIYALIIENANKRLANTD